jgi:hypothetical protein
VTNEEELELLNLLEVAEREFVERTWYAGDLYYKLHAGQRLIYDIVKNLPQGVRDVLFLCARRFGKSFLIVIMALEDCLRNPGVVVRIVGPELGQTLEIVEYNLNKIINDAPSGLIRPQGTRRRWRVGDSLLIIGAFDNKNVRKNLGKEAFSIYTEEIGNAKSADVDYGMREILGPQLFYSKGRFTHGTTPPPDLDHVLETELIPKADMAGTLFRFDLYQNPLADQEMIDQAIADSGGIETVAFRRNYLVQSVKDDQVVIIPTFDIKRHVKEFEIPTHAMWLLGGDWGGVIDRTWAGVGFWDYARGKLCIVAEEDHDPNTRTGLIASGLRHLETLMQPIKQVLPKADEPHWPRWMDCPGQTQTDLTQDHDFDCQLPIKDEFSASIGQLVMAFHNDQIEIHPRCKKLIATCEYGRLTKNRKDMLRTPTLGHCDAVAGLKYIWRMVDKTTNPFPKQKYIREDYWVPHEDETEHSLREFAKQVKTF